ncbi:MAG: DNA-3-methyladenine glycosylase family protein [Bacteroidota bacterium]
MKLRRIKTLETVPTAPFNFDPTFHKPDHFTSGDNYWEPGTRWQTWSWAGERFGLIFRNQGSISNPSIRISIYASHKMPDRIVSSLVDEIQYRYNLKLDLCSFYNAFGKDKVLGPIIERWAGMRPGHPSSLYEYLIIGIVLQNANVRRSIQMFGALLNKYGTCLEFDRRKLWCFWEPGALQGVTEEELRALKVGYRARSIKRIDDYYVQGKIDELDLRKKDQESQRRELLKLYGVGPATVWYLMFDVFHHWDFFNHISPWEQKIYSKLFFDQDPEHPVEVSKILEHFERFGNYKQLAVHYIWEDLWWQRKNGQAPWLEKLIRD